ncbi:2-aminomuconic semialdehyde dehydrogenase-like [Apostichopus japonicus]|uniref:2-aminomuconic semialdehyde dehydrogenase-like n=1 Tax=Stichopus japonicus TaxID=307972 RepID=UPI003AB11968
MEVVAAKKMKTMALEVQNFIGGEFIPAKTHLDSFNPATGEVWAKIPDSGKEEIDLAVKSAKQAFPSWSSLSPEVRGQHLHKIADILESRLDEFAEIESRDQGKPVGLAKKVDIPRAVQNLRFFATAIQHTLNDSTVQSKFGVFNYTTKNPIGVAGLISPWNLPLYLLTLKIGPCIAVGNTCICKPSEMTSVSAWMLCEVMKQAGLPPGVVNMVFGYGHKVGQSMVEHPEIPVISFTGGTATGKKIISSSAANFKKLSLELGGKNAAIIFDDADLEQCIPMAVRSSFTNQGEVCIATSRIFVQEKLYPRFLELFIEATRKLKVGPPTESTTDVGALISKEHLAKVKGYVDIAIEEGGRIECGERSQDEELSLPESHRNGYFMRPTVITNLKDTSRCMQEEIFGPVTCVVPFQTEEEVIERANGVQFGLCASVWTTDLGTAHRVAHKLEVGAVWTNCGLIRDLNMPFGGIKASGIGRESAKESLNFYTEDKTICIKMT